MNPAAIEPFKMALFENHERENNSHGGRGGFLGFGEAATMTAQGRWGYASEFRVENFGLE